MGSQFQSLIFYPNNCGKIIMNNLKFSFQSAEQKNNDVWRNVFRLKIFANKSRRKYCAHLDKKHNQNKNNNSILN